MTPESIHPTVEDTGDAVGGPVPPTPKPKLTICPYCGSRSRSLAACESCRGKFDPLSRQATQNAMGPWFIREEANPHRPGCSYETLVRLVARGSVTGETVIRGPASRQFWTLARWCPGVAHLLGHCHSCQRPVDPVAPACEACGASFRVHGDRQTLGLGEVRFVPGRAEARGESAIGAAEDRVGGPGENRARDVGAAGIDPRVLRLERELRGARRWRALWFAVCCVGLLGVGGVLVGQRLDLGRGVLGRWLGRGEGAGGPAGGETGGADAGVTPITTPPLTGRVGSGASAEVQAGAVRDEGGEHEDLPVGDPGPGLVPDASPAPGGVPAHETPAPATAGSVARLGVLERLRGLR